MDQTKTIMILDSDAQQQLKFEMLCAKWEIDANQSVGK